MSDERELIDPHLRFHQTIAGMWYATVCVPLPVDENGDLFVIIHDIDSNTRFGPCFWSPRIKTVSVDVSEGVESSHMVDIGRVDLPVVGSECLVIFDNRQNVWVTQWA